MAEGTSGFVAVVAAGEDAVVAFVALVVTGDVAAVAAFLCLCLAGLADAAGVGDGEALWANNGAAENTIAAMRRGMSCFMTRMVGNSGRLSMTNVK